MTAGGGGGEKGGGCVRCHTPIQTTTVLQANRLSLADVPMYRGLCQRLHHFIGSIMFFVFVCFLFFLFVFFYTSVYVMLQYSA